MDMHHSGLCNGLPGIGFGEQKTAIGVSFRALLLLHEIDNGQYDYY